MASAAAKKHIEAPRHRRGSVHLLQAEPSLSTREGA